MIDLLADVVYGQAVEVKARHVACFVAERLCPLPLACLTRQLLDQCCENPRRVVTCCAYDVPGLKRWDCLNCGRNGVVWSGV